jgi:hypothetical protein
MTAVATDQSRVSESVHSGFILLMSNGTLRAAWQTLRIPTPHTKNCSGAVEGDARKLPEMPLTRNGNVGERSTNKGGGITVP